MGNLAKLWMSMFITLFSVLCSLLCPNNVSQQHTSTPTIQSNISPACHTVERITPVEHGSAPSMYKPEECKVKETSSSDEFYSPSLPLKEIPSEEEQGI